MEAQLDLSNNGLPAPIAPGRRGASRARLALSARAVSFDRTVRCTILDASQSGARIACDELPRVGSMVVIEIPPIEFFGTVSWTDEGLFGMQFDDLLPFEAVVELRQMGDLYSQSSEARELRRAAKEFVEGRHSSG